MTFRNVAIFKIDILIITFNIVVHSIIHNSFAVFFVKADQ
jgi:hypothetical protein